MKMKRTRLIQFAWMVVMLVLAGLFHAATAQATNGTFTNTPPIDPSQNPFPVGKEAIWLALIPPATFTITWLIGKIPPLPKEILPWITPVVGVILGAVINYATSANWPWWSSAGFGAISVAIYEGLKGLTGAGPRSKLTPTSETKKPTV